MLAVTTLRKIRHLELRTRKLVENSFAGAYHSVFKGRGIEFDSVRPYQPGDDIRSIDWNVTARTGEPFVKNYVEERELTVMLLLDASASCFFGSGKQQKRDLAVELAVAFAYSAIVNQDKVGLMLFSDQVELYLSPRKGRNHILRLIRELLVVKPSSKGTDIGLVLRTVNRLLKRRAIIFIMSDFLENTETYANDLALTARKHDVIAVVLSDQMETTWKNVGLVALQDAETHDVRWIDTHQNGWIAGFEKQSEQFRRMRNSALNRAGVDRIELQSDDDYISALTAFFRRRTRPSLQK
jgi:uncharacterized protein (DUF58 family)